MTLYVRVSQPTLLPLCVQVLGLAPFYLLGLHYIALAVISFSQPLPVSLHFLTTGYQLLRQVLLRHRHFFFSLLFLTLLFLEFVL